MAENDLIRERLAKLAAFRAAGIEPYPSSFKRTHSCASVALGITGVSVGGRVRGKRVQGGVMFLVPERSMAAFRRVASGASNRGLREKKDRL